MHRVALTLLTLGLCCPVISAARSQTFLETMAGIKFCRTLKEDAQRLKCFDGLFVEKPAETRREAKPDIEAVWQISEDKSPIDDSPQILASLNAVGGDSSLILRCKEKKTEAMFTKPFTYFGSNSVKVLVRIDDGKPIETRWNPSTSGQAAFAPSAIQFIRALPENGKIFVRAFAYNGSSADGEFKLGQISDVRVKIAQACNWPKEGPQSVQEQSK